MVNIFSFGTSQKMIDHAFSNIIRDTKSKRTEIERKLINSWINERNMNDVATIANHIYANDKFDSFDEKVNLSQAMINMINATQCSGALVYIQNPKNEDDLAIYFHDSNTDLILSDLSDISMNYGDASVARALNIALNSSWRKDKKISDFMPFDYYYKKTKEMIKNKEDSEKINTGNLEYFINSNDDKVWHYILPLYNKDTLSQIGMIATEIDLKLIEDMFYYEELSEKSTSAYILARQSSSQSKNEYDIIAMKGAYVQNLLNGSKLRLKEFSERNEKESNYMNENLTFKLDLESNENYIAIKEPIRIQNSNSAQDDSYFLLAIIDRDEIESTSTQFQKGIIIMIISTIIVGFILAVLVSRKLTRDIVMISEEIRNNKQGKDFNIKPTNIIEFDNLVNVINNLSNRLTENSNKFQNILEISSASVVAIEVDIENEKVYRIGKFNSIFFGMVKEEEFEEVMSLEEFQKRQVELFETATLYKEYFDKKTMSNIQILEKEWNGERKFVKIITNRQDLSDIEGKKVSPNRIVSKMILDNTAEINEQMEIIRQRDTDSLTGLSNRLSFNNRIRKKIKENPDIKAAMVMWDMDELKYINDTFGHEFGDQYLISMADALRMLENENTIVARISGDEFFAFIIYDNDKAEVLERIEHLRSLLTKTNLDYLNNISIKVTTGISWYPEDTDNIQELFKFADFAMYTAKHRKKGTIEEFNHKEYEQNYILLSGNQHFYQFLEKRELRYAFQPIVDAKNGEVYSYEALMRPTSKHLTNVGSVMKFAKYQSKLTEIEILTFDEVLKFVLNHLDKFDGKKIFINSIANVSLPDDTVIYLEKEYGEILDKLVIEIIEQEDLEDKCLKVKQSFREKFGCKIAIDDYGSGYSSQAWFLQVHPDFAKIDMTLLSGIDKDAEKQEIVKHIISYCSKMNIKVISEGVETYEEMKTLINLGVDYLQGYYLSKPNFEIVEIPENIKKEILDLN